MLHSYSMEVKRVILKPLKKEHIETLRVLRNKESKWFVHSEEVDRETQLIWFKKYQQKNDDYMFSVFEVKRPEIFIGTVALYNINEKTCEFGRIIIDHSVTNEKGLGYDTTICACKIGFEQFGLDKIILEVFNDNIPAIKTYKKVGFIVYGEENRMLKMVLKKERFYKKGVND